jgi:hypothetical protein
MQTKIPTTEETIKAWDRKMRAAPSFEEVRDVEWIRRSGRINMITDNLQQELYDRNRLDGVMWLERCRRNRVTWISYWDEAIAAYESKYGPRNKWFTSDLVDEWKDAEIDREERQLLDRLEEIKSRRRAKKDPLVVD